MQPASMSSASKAPNCNKYSFLLFTLSILIRFRLFGYKLSGFRRRRRRGRMRPRFLRTQRREGFEFLFVFAGHFERVVGIVDNAWGDQDNDFLSVALAIRVAKKFAQNRDARQQRQTAS